MFGKRHKKEHYRRRANPILGLFRLLLSLVIFAALIGGVYYAYREFSGFDPLKLSPKSLSSFFTKEKLADFGFNLLSFDVKKKAQDLTGQVSGQTKIIPADTKEKTPVKKPTSLFKFALVADSENDNDLLGKALSQAKEKQAKFVIGLGDYSDVGTVSELRKAKLEFDKAGLRYYVTPGDHDLWDSRNRKQPALTNFKAVFGASYSSFDQENVHFLILNNSDNYSGFDSDQLNWVNSDLASLKNKPMLLSLAFLSEPLFHPSSDHFMGKTTPSLQTQAKTMIRTLKEANFKAVFAGDIHYFTEYTEPASGLSMTTVGAVNQERNIEEPRFAIITVMDDGSLIVEDTEIK